MEPPRPILLLPPASFFHGLDFVASSSKTAQRFIVGGKPVLLFPDPSSESIGSDATIDGGGSGGASEFADDEHAAKTGTSLWDCSIVLAKFIEDMTLNGDDDERQIFSVKDKRVIELGSGIGLLGISIYNLPSSHITFTDLPAIVAKLPRTLSLNGISPTTDPRISLANLDWTTFNSSHLLASSQLDPTTRAHMLVASDVLWLPHLVPPFLDTLALLVVDTSQRLLMGYQERSSRVTAIFTKGLVERGLKHRVIEWKGMARGAAWERPGIEIWEVTVSESRY